MSRTPLRLPLAEEPRVSVVILAYRNASLLGRCLASIEATASLGLPFETIVVANGASPEVLAVLDHIEGLRVVRSDRNLGFAGGCNLGAGHARGDLLVLLNDDVEVEAGWMQALVETADGHPDAGAVGSRMTFTDGTLHEAGQIVWADGSTTAVGRGLPGDTPRWRYLRQVDYCSAASLLVRTSAWRAVGGMDEGFHPGYCEDVDLCFAIQEAGWRILYEPRSVVRHHESSSFDPVLRKFLMLRGRSRLTTKWPERLARHEPDPDRHGAEERALHRARGFPRRILVVAETIEAGTWIERLADGLDLRRNAVVVCAPRSGTGPKAALEARGIEVIDEPPEAHLSRPEVLYDAVVLGPHSGACEPAVRRHQGHAALLAWDGAGPPAAAASWEDSISAALLGRTLRPVGARTSVERGGA